MNKYVKELFGYCAESDFNPDIVIVALPDAYNGGLIRGLILGSAVTGLAAFAISKTRKKKELTAAS